MGFFKPKFVLTLLASLLVFLINETWQIAQETFAPYPTTFSYPVFGNDEADVANPVYVKTFTFDFSLYKTAVVPTSLNGVTSTTTSKVVPLNHPQYWVNVNVAFWVKIPLTLPKTTEYMKITYDGASWDTVTYQDTEATNGTEGRGVWQFIFVQYWAEEGAPQIKRAIKCKYAHGAVIAV